MSANKLNQSLDDILTTTRQSNRRGRGGRRGGDRANASGGPVGGIQKNPKTKQQIKPAPTPQGNAAVTGGDTKLMISNLPLDVDENQLKEYFQSALNVGRPKKVQIQYGATGKSLGTATVIFAKYEQAVKATNALDKVKIDNRPIRVEMVVSAANVPAAAPQPTLAERATQAKKDKPKPAINKPDTANGRGRGRGPRGRGRGRGGRNANGREKKKTIEELDAEMEDYFPTTTEGNNNVAANGAAPATAGGDVAMDDEML